MNERDYQRKQNEEKMRLLWRRVQEPDFMDQDVFNLKMILLDIAPYSRWWRWGYMRSLKRAIKAIERENKERG